MPCGNREHTSVLWVTMPRGPRPNGGEHNSVFQIIHDCEHSDAFVRGVEPSSGPSGAGVGGDAVTFAYNISPKGNKNNYYLAI
jgi:hypothetical protein